MTARHKRYLQILQKRVAVLTTRLAYMSEKASFYGEVLQEKHAVEWAIAVIYAANDLNEINNEAPAK